MVILLNTTVNIMSPLQYDTKHLHFFIWGARGGGEGDGGWGGGGGRGRGTPIYVCLSLSPCLHVCPIANINNTQRYHSFLFLNSCSVYNVLQARTRTYARTSPLPPPPPPPHTHRHTRAARTSSCAERIILESVTCKPAGFQSRDPLWLSGIRLESWISLWN